MIEPRAVVDPPVPELTKLAYLLSDWAKSLNPSGTG